ncbi:hypothetical protein CTA1_9415 [Colletotrichum tanaceti]|uniref:Uncharacterized protein n=1 Tax=Colletotrichum tanaceti TaxID=1306861 RepID=A0A4U6XLR0_9PEZI|nr:hypothetical protein CTA1_9415 [Colletotrichum tanaceti]
MPTARKRQATPETPAKKVTKGHYTFETEKMGLEKADFRHVAEQRFPDDAIRVEENIVRAAEEGAVRVGTGVEDAKEAEFKKKEEEYAFDL